MTDKLKALVEKLGTLKSNRCSICGDYDYGKPCSCGQKEYDPILIGDIIFKINQAQVSKLVQLWRPLGNKSLQEIGEIRTYRPIGGKTGKIKKQIKPQAQELINFLTEIL